MASMTMTATFLGGSAATKQLPTMARRHMAVVVGASRNDSENKMVIREESNNSRRDLMFAAAAAAACAVAKAAMADEPKRGTPEAKKKYAPVCVTMPTARICRN